MKNFDEFVKHIVANWRAEKKAILEQVGLGVPSNREYGDLAEDYILKRIKKLEPNYNAQKTSGSQSPADIISVARRNGYWHIMLIQVKSSPAKETIEKLKENDKKVFDEFAKFIKKEIVESELLKDYRKKPIIISNGYAGVLRTKTAHRLASVQSYKIFKLNASLLNISDVKQKIKIAHRL